MLRFLSLILAAALVPQVVRAEVTPQPTFEQAQELAAHGQLDQALAMLNQLATQTPEPAGVERLRGMIFYQKDQFPEAVSAFSKAEAQNAGDLESIEMHGVALFRLGRSEEAVPFLEGAHAAVERANIDPQYVLGLCYTNVKRFADARRAFAMQYGFAPESAEAHLLAARLFLRRDFLDQASSEARIALQLKPHLPLAHELLGEASLAKGDLPHAIGEFEAERDINPLDGMLYERLGDAYLRSSQLDKAQKALNRAVVLEPTSTAPYILLGHTFLKLGHPIEAVHYLDHAVKMDPSNYHTHYLLGQAYKATGQLAEAEREIRQSVALQEAQSSAQGK